MSITGPYRPDSLRRHRERRFRIPVPQLPGRRPLNDSSLDSPAARARMTQRVRIAEGVVIALVTLLLLTFWRLQVVQATHYRELAENNRRRDIVVRAPRGLIVDRDGELLAINRPSYNIALVREDIDDLEATLRWLGDVLGLPVGKLQERLERHRGTPLFRPVVIEEDVDLSTVSAIEIRRREHPGVLVQPELRRLYPHGPTAAHVLGYVREITAEQLDAWGRDRYRMGDIVGHSGIERTYNDALMGTAGERKLIVNSAGRTVRVLDQAPPQPGNTLTLTLDLELQQAAEALLEDRKGAVVVLDARTGGVLALASAPSFDPNMFSRRFSAGEWEALVNDPANPLRDRALQDHYPPGSIFKLVLAVAGLEQGVVTPDTTVFCPGGKTILGRFFGCTNAHGYVNLVSAIGRSCNVYFYELGRMLGREAIVEAARRFGLGALTDIDLPNEASGILPTDAWLGVNREGRWYPGETISLAIGQGPIQTTPLQLAHLAAMIGSGMRLTPHLVQREENAVARSAAIDHVVAQERIAVQPAVRKKVLEGMWAVVNDNGTGWRARSTRLSIGGKTGTAQVVSADAAGPEEERPEELRNHAWFIGLAPVDDPEVAVAVLVEHGGGGGAVAAPIAGRLLNRYLELQSSRPADETVATSAGRATSGGGR